VPPKADPSASAGRRLQRWQKQKPFSDEAHLAAWLAAHGLTRDGLLDLFDESPDDLQGRTARPAWLETLRRVRAVDAVASGDSIGDLAVNASRILPTALAPLVRIGLSSLQEQLASLTQQYPALPFQAAAVVPPLLENLSGQLLPVLSRTMALELNVARLQGRLSGDTPEARFADFLRQLEDGAIWPLLDEYPVLARQIVIQVEQWARFSLEVLERLARDWPEICASIAAGVAPGQLVEIRGGAGDTHRQGRSVLTLKFSGGFQLVYKPRSLALDVHFQELLAWLNERGDHPPFRLTRLLDRGSYGWVEFIVAEGCETTEEVERFYQRQGGYLALLYMLEATDFHYENLIAAGEHPVLIDLEALFHPALSEPAVAHADDPAAEVLGRSVLLTGLLPQRVFGDGDHAGIDLSGLNGQAGQLSPRPGLRWQGVGTDQMRAVRERFELPGQQNRPRLLGHDVQLLDYVEPLTAGFTRVYRLLVRERDALSAGPLARFARDEIRLLVRPTNAYARLLQDGCHPDLLRDALERERFFAMLWAATSQQPWLVRLIPAELADLWNGDIPTFTATPGSCDAFDSRGERIADLLAESGLDRAWHRLRGMGEDDLARQRWIIQASLASIPTDERKKARRTPPVTPASDTATPDRLLHAARAAGDRLCELAIFDDERANWLTLSAANEREWQLTTAGLDLYDGLPGIILTLAYLGHATGEGRYWSFARAGLRTLRRKVTALQQNVTTVGAFNGWGSLVYLHSHLYALWDDAECLHEAEQAAARLGEAIEQDESLDIIGGSAGAILALLSLHRVGDARSALELATRCGQHLAAAAQPMTGGFGWRHPRAADTPLTGFSHGAAGIAYSLLALAGASGEEQYRELAQAGIAYERSVFCAEHQNWPDLRDPGEHDCQRAAWCHGATGIGLARLVTRTN
jgi:type 2 lantibiotic biosynthesis protein LanM